MLDHFTLLAPIYERVIRPPDVSRLRDLLGLPTEGLLLDAGGGTGRVSCQFLHEVGGLVIADPSLGMLAQARAKGCRHPLRARVERLPLASGAFQRVLAVDSFHHFADQETALAELWRVLATGGRLVIEEPDIQQVRVKVIALLEKLTGMRSHFVAPLSLAQRLSALGAEVQVVLDGRLTAWIVADKAP